MINPTRRAIIGAVAASSLAPLLRPSAAGAAAPATGKQAPGFYRYKVGGFECTSLNDGALTYPITPEYVTNVSKDQVIAAAEAAYFPKDMVVCPYNPQVINTGSKLLLIDTGWGPGVDPAVGQVLRNMVAAGIDPGTVDTVIISHFHRDHINGLRKADGALAFPNAEIKVPAPEWAFWMSDDNMSKASGNMMQGNFANARKMFAGLADRVTKYEWGQEVVPGITAIETPGHTPGHTSFAVQSGPARVLIQSDVTNIPALFVRHPDWHVMYDHGEAGFAR
jgi:glyoxylase-like metal-dependent hydrolase (beta-lactamase superfamily II)